MERKHVEDVKMDFILSVYESIQGQIRHADLKVSLILSWDSISAVMLGREIASMVSAQTVSLLKIALVSAVLLALVLSGFFIFGTLKPRARGATGPEFKGLLYTGDILRLAEDAPGRMKAYLSELSKLGTNEEIHAQFVGSIVSISEIVAIKNTMFMRALAATATGFSCLVALIALVGAGAVGLK